MTATTLERLADHGVLSPLDLALARTLARMAGEDSPEVLLAIALTSRAVHHGHVCVELGELRHMPLFDVDDEPLSEVSFPEPAAFCAALEASPLTGDGDEATPLVLRGQRLYLRRYFDYQRRLAAEIRARAEPVPDVDVTLLESGLERLFGGCEESSGAQRLAAAVAVRRRLAVIAGGPGTGKTTTVVKILALLQEQALAGGGRPARLLLLAPTGKAAQRLGEAIAAQLDGLPCSAEVRSLIPREASTIHRALGYQARQPTRFVHHRARPLAVDAVVADEASMIDLALMTKLVEAVPRRARLILLGDRDQLASVEAGAILGDICAAENTSSVADSLVELRHSHRFGADSGIGALARAVNAGDADEALALLAGERAMPHGQVTLADLDERDPLAGALGNAVRDGFGPALAADSPAERLARSGRFRILCAHRRGRLGVEAMNQQVQQHLQAHGLLRIDGPYYDGRPILVTRNDHQLRLYNGDLGVVLCEPDGPRVWFQGPGSEPRAVRPARLPPHETVFAMTVHKSQGSELDRVAVLLPERATPILSRELIYTAISRARQRVDIFGGEQVLRQAIARRVQRASGLTEALL